MYKPMYDNVVLKLDEQKSEEVTGGGIIIQNTEFSQVYVDGEVIAIGDGYLRDSVIVPLRVKVGDKVIVRKNTDIKIKIDGEEYSLLSEANILAVK